MTQQKTKNNLSRSAIPKPAMADSKDTSSEIKLIFDNIPTKIWFKDENNTILKLNKAAAKALGGKPEDFLGRNASELFDASGYKFFEDDDKIIKSGIAELGIIEEVIPSNAPPRWVSTDKIPFLDSATGALRLLIASTDITNIKETKSQLRDTINKLTESNNELERFAHAASHDMQEPLRTLSNFSYLINSEYAHCLDETASNYFRFIQGAAEKLKNIVADLLEYSLLDKNSSREDKIDTHTQIKQVIEMLEVVRREHKSIISTGNLPVIIGNSFQFARLIQNLMDNALKYHTPGKDPIINIEASENDEYWVFSVADNGIGIEKEFALDVFEPFKRLHLWQEHKGTGLGLSLSKRIVEAHGGRLWVEPNKPEGSVFLFTWPKA